jgi:hypothetical protein
MEAIDKERIHIQHCKNIISAFLEINKDEVSEQAQDLFHDAENELDCKVKLDEFSRIENENLTIYQKIKLIKNLSALSKEIQPSGTELARKRISEYSAKVETALLNQFENAYKVNDVEAMAVLEATYHTGTILKSILGQSFSAIHT